MCHGYQPLTGYPSLRKKEITERKGGKWTTRLMGAPEHACVKQLSNICAEVIYGEGLCVKEHHPFYPLFFADFSITLTVKTHLCSFPRKKKLGLTQLTALHRSKQRSTYKQSE